MAPIVVPTEMPDSERAARALADDAMYCDCAMVYDADGNPVKDELGRDRVDIPFRRNTATAKWDEAACSGKGGWVETSDTMDFGVVVHGKGRVFTMEGGKQGKYVDTDDLVKFNIHSASTCLDLAKRVEKECSVELAPKGDAANLEASELAAKSLGDMGLKSGTRLLVVKGKGGKSFLTFVGAPSGAGVFSLLI